MWLTASVEHVPDQKGVHLGSRQYWLLPGGRSTRITISPTVFYRAQQRFTLSGPSRLLDVLQNARWPPQGPSSDAPVPSSHT